MTDAALYAIDYLTIEAHCKKCNRWTQFLLRKTDPVHPKEWPLNCWHCNSANIVFGEPHMELWRELLEACHDRA